MYSNSLMGHSNHLLYLHISNPTLLKQALMSLNTTPHSAVLVTLTNELRDGCGLNNYPRCAFYSNRAIQTVCVVVGCVNTPADKDQTTCF